MKDFKGGSGVIILFGLFVAVYAVDQDSRTQLSTFVTKPFGPFYCRARCVATCLNMNLAANITDCATERCSDFNDDTPCASDDKTCWQNCGNDPTTQDSQEPLPIKEITTTFDVINEVIDPYTVRIEWEPENDINLYIVEVFSMENGLELNGKKIVQTMTTTNFYLFQKPDLCGSFMARVILVNKSGLSIPHYKRINEWSPPDDTNLQLTVKSISRPTLDVVKVEIRYNFPETWQEDDVTISDFVVRAYDCSGIVMDGLFSNAKPDEKGFYFPYVFTNITQSGIIELSFSSDIMYAQCKFTYKVLALYSRCEVETTFDVQNKTNEVDFAINCGTVANANCGTGPPTPITQVQDEPSEPRPATPPASPWSAQIWDNETVASFEKQIEKNYGRIPDEDSTAHEGTPLPPAPIPSSEEIFKETQTDENGGTTQGNHILANLHIQSPIMNDVNSTNPLPSVIIEHAQQSEAEQFEAAAFSHVLAGSLVLVILVSILMLSLGIWYTNHKRNHRRQDEYLINV